MNNEHKHDHSDHEHDHSDHESWLADHRSWRIEHSKLLATLHRIEAEIHEHEAHMQEHEQTIAAHEAKMACHEKQISEHERTGDGAGHEAAQVEHDMQHQAHEDSARNHEQLKERHQAICHKLKGLSLDQIAWKEYEFGYSITEYSGFWALNEPDCHNRWILPENVLKRWLKPIAAFAAGLLLGGLAIGAFFLVDIRAGTAAWITVALHELLQEIGDFGAMVHAGYAC